MGEELSAMHLLHCYHMPERPGWPTWPSRLRSSPSRPDPTRCAYQDVSGTAGKVRWRASTTQAVTGTTAEELRCLERVRLDARDDLPDADNEGEWPTILGRIEDRPIRQLARVVHRQFLSPRRERLPVAGGDDVLRHAHLCQAAHK